MKLVQVGMAVIGVALIGLFFLERDAATRKATLRVERMLDGWLEGGTGSNGAVQEAVFQWNHGTKHMPEDKSVGQASLEFDDWRREQRMYRKISSYRVERAEIDEGSDPRSVRVDILIDDRPYAVRVMKDRPVQWID